MFSTWASTLWQLQVTLRLRLTLGHHTPLSLPNMWECEIMDPIKSLATATNHTITSFHPSHSH
jgi:hypothetical protein